MSKTARGLARPTRRSNALSVSVQVLAALRYFGTGSFQAVAGDCRQALWIILGLMTNV